MFDFSIIAPVYKMKGNLGERFLVEYLCHLSYQTFKNFEVVIPDQSNDDSLKKICDTFSHIMNIKHINNPGSLKTAAANVNFGIKNATGKLVKLLYVDDFFMDPDALFKIKTAFDSNLDSKWLISGFICCNEDRLEFYNERQPRYSNKYVNGDNVTGNPSNYTVRRECALEMDEKLLWIVDGEYFYRSYYHYGDPIMIDDTLVCFRDHGDSAFKRPELQELDAKERQYCRDKFSGIVEHKLI